MLQNNSVGGHLEAPDLVDSKKKGINQCYRLRRIPDVLQPGSQKYELGSI